MLTLELTRVQIEIAAKWIGENSGTRQFVTIGQILPGDGVAEFRIYGQDCFYRVRQALANDNRERPKTCATTSYEEETK